LGAVLVPGDCVLCARLLPHPLEGPICPGCLDRLPRVIEPLCPRCGLPFEALVAPGLCGPCRAGARWFRRARAGFVYDDDVRRAVHALKFGGREKIGRVLGALAAAMWELPEYAAVVPVPLSRKRRRARGFNQAEVVARAVGKVLGVPVSTRILSKPKESPPQAGLTASSRRRNVSGAYRAQLPSSLRRESLLLVDDVLTTGATAEAAARVLRRGGAGAVDVLTLARVP